MVEVEVFFQKFIKILTVSTARLYGLWPHRFDSKLTSLLFLIYSLAFSSATPIVFFTYYLSIYDNLSYAFNSFAVVLLDDMYLYLIVIQFLTLYLGIYIKHKRIKIFLAQASDMYEASFKMGVRYLRVWIRFLFKSIVYDICFSFVVIVGPFLDSKAPLANVVGAIIINLPPTVVRVVPNLYYGCIMGGQLCYRDINNRIRLLRSRIDENTVTVDYICEELDQLCIGHFSVTKFMNECNALCSLQVVLLIVYQVIGLQFFVILQVVFLKRGTDFLDNALNIVLFIITMIDLYTTFAVCEHILHEVIKFLFVFFLSLRYIILFQFDCTSRLLNSILIERVHLDKEVRKSVRNTVRNTVKGVFSSLYNFFDRLLGQSGPDIPY